MIFALILGISPAVLANDSAVADYAGQMRLLKEESISIQKETLEFFSPQYDHSKGAVKAPIRVSYVMKNESAHARHIDLAFPLPLAKLPSLKGSSVSSYPNSDLPTMDLTVDGKKVAGRWEQQIVCNGKRLLLGRVPEDLPTYDHEEFCEKPETTRTNPEWTCTQTQKSACAQLKEETGVKDCGQAMAGCTVSRVFRWEYDFPPDKELHVVHDYDSRRGMAQQLPANGEIPSSLIASEKIIGSTNPKDVFCLNDMGPNWREKIDPGAYSWNEYVLIPGANWKGPIRYFELVIHRNADEIISTCFPGLKKTGVNEFRSVIKDLTPTADIVIGYLKPRIEKPSRPTGR